MKKLAKVINMEFRLTVANKVFVILTLFGPFFIAGIAILPGMLLKSSEVINGPVKKIALAGADARFLGEVAPLLKPSGIEVGAVRGNTSSLDSQLRSGAYSGYIIIPGDQGEVSHFEYVSMAAVDFRLSNAIQNVIGRAIVTQRLLKIGIPASRAASFTQPPVFESRRLMQDGKTRKNPDFTTIFMTGLIFAILLYMTVLLYGQGIGRSVLSEKTNKTVEIMLSSVRPMDLLFGKILGKGLASLLQYGIWVAISTVLLKLIGPFFTVPMGIELSLYTFAYLVLFFILAFFLYCSIYAALGAASEDEQHLGQLAWPVVVFLMIPVVMISQVISAPHSPLIVGLSFFPLTAPIIMFLRILMGAARPWEILSSVMLIIIATAALARLSSQIFRVGILMTGKRLKFHEILRLGRYR